MSRPEFSVETKAVHSGERRRFSPEREKVAYPVAGGVSPSVSYVYDDSELLDAALGSDPDLPVYFRYGNPTTAAFEEAMIALECHEGLDEEEYCGFATGSGMAAIQLAMAAAGAGAGKTIAASQDCYGATYSLVADLWPRYGAQGLFVDTTDLDAVRSMLEKSRPLFLIVETISNPLLRVADLRALADLCHAYDALLLVDNTFATPLLCRPLSLGADMVIHSATKYIGGHGDVMGGIVVAHRRHRENLWDYIKKTGSNLGAQEAWLLHRGLKTLALRIERQCSNAAEIASQLLGWPEVARVYYPGLSGHPQFGLAQSQFADGLGGAVVSFEVAGADRQRIFSLLESLQLIQPATTVGDVYTLMLYPAHSSHRALSKSERAAVGIRDGLVRLSIGLETTDDILNDLRQALQRTVEIADRRSLSES